MGLSNLTTACDYVIRFFKVTQWALMTILLSFPPFCQTGPNRPRSDRPFGKFPARVYGQSAPEKEKEQEKEMAFMLNYRFGPGTWEEMLELRRAIKKEPGGLI